MPSRGRYAGAAGSVGQMRTNEQTRADVMPLRELLASRGITQEAAGVLAGVHTATMSRICTGQTRAAPKTVVRLATALRIGPRKMLAACDASWRAAHPESEPVSV